MLIVVIMGLMIVRIELSTMSGCMQCCMSRTSAREWSVHSHLRVRTECGMFVMYCMQCCMSVSAVL